MDCTIRVAKTKALISFAVTAKLICVYVFANAKGLFSHNEAHLSLHVFNITIYSSENKNPESPKLKEFNDITTERCVRCLLQLYDKSSNATNIVKLHQGHQGAFL